MSRRTFYTAEMEKWFHFRDEYDGSMVPLYAVYAPEYRGDQYRDWGDAADLQA